MSKKTDKTSNLVKILALTAFILVFVWLVFFEKNNTIVLVTRQPR